MAKRVESGSMRNSDVVSEHPAQQRLLVPGRLLAALAVLAVGAGLLLWLTPAGWTGPRPVEVTNGASAATYRLITDLVGEGPDWLHMLVELATEGSVLILVFLLVWTWWTGRRRGAQIVGGTVLVGLGMTSAYLTSEVFKLIVDEERPCRALSGVETVVTCPGIGDWSFPSNHTTIAAGLAVGLAVVAPRIAALTLPLAALAAALRVLAGVHYPHDVLAGFVLGGAVTAATVIALTPLATYVIRWMGSIPAFRFLVLANAPRTAGKPTNR
ncbi:phosphatase PAP2 family protein [Micromonospora polyrhachis]|uniref:Undecaprenyl-diphosphatase n=1 Tax=Micromonospora polyrhachis TaxID=1282883 RepID=A0A7W7SRX0_9ACTN|nr:phosphatase PAP2 family protein [Micromonospora polyrhachis]MBB4959845.1 undecaprenyl-diphosphatase [Micromonospora polyrhachis]